MPPSHDADQDEGFDRYARASEFPSGPRATAWVLEDSPQQALAVQAALQSLLKVRIFHDSPQLLESLASEQPDVLLLDWQVPQISGLEVLQLVRERHDEVTLPALMLTGDQRSGQGPLEALAAGANDFATKPFMAAELRARVSTLVRVRMLHARARRAERELAITAERLRRVFEASGAGLWELDTQTGKVDADARMLELMGMPAGATMGLEYGLGLLHPDDEQRVRATIEATLRGEQQGYLVEFRTGGRDGMPLRWVESRAQATFDRAGVATRLAGTIVDISVRKHAELEREALLARVATDRADAMREREKLYNLFQEAPVAMAVLEGPHHVFSYANPAYRALVDQRDVVGKRLHEALPDVMDTGFEQLLDGVIATGEQVLLKELRVPLERHDNDEALIMNFAYNAKTNERGQRDGVVMFGWDVTEVVLARQRLAVVSAQQQASEAQLRLLTDAIPMLVSFVAPDETYGFVNRAYEEWFGVTSEQILGRTVREVVGDAAYAVMGPYVKRGLAGERFSFEQYGVPYQHRGVRDVRVNFVPLKLSEAAAAGYVTLLEDITAQRKVEAEREKLTNQRTEDLQRQAQFEQQLIGIVSHDLRTPLNVIALSSARLARDEQQSASALKNVVRIQNATDRAVRMVADLLDFTQSRLGGGIRIEPRNSDVRTLIDALLAELEAAYPERKIECTHEGDGHGEWDPERISQLAQNLITNALKYSPPDSVVEVGTRTEHGAMTLRVHNIGDAIPAAKLPVVFEPLQRGVEQVDRVTRSVGLGLYIVKKIAEAHGGSVNVASSETTGTTFTVTLPTRR